MYAIRSYYAVDSTGLLTDGRLLALNSYENRVYQVGIEDADPRITSYNVCYTKL